ncbi:acyl-CoA reductase [Pseudofulvibacter geojedonensis]|uniref:long-chain-fatty-acyl-CoA reductase n=1 Tax=Pseudofulvibacter geojedonensis TaxID=1123758 RepID=A0ABW3HY64_9FLAO
MSNIIQRIEAFSQLGQFLSQFTTERISKKEQVLHNDLFFDAFKMQVERAQEFNGWFTLDNVLFSCEGWSKSLTNENLNKFIDSINIKKNTPKTIAIIMAGNIPLVGFHDFLSVLLMGNSVVVKQSSNDKHLLPILAKYLEYIEPSLKGQITFTEEKLENFDAVIATGSNNTARYFDYYFGKYPSIIRKNRNSIAILTGNETDDELNGLADDIFRYFGLGCRSVSKLFIPKGYNFDKLFNAVFKYKDIINNAKYANNYDYNKAVYLMSLFDLLENGFLMLKEDTSYASPIASLFYEYYDDSNSLKEKINSDKEKIQCVVGNGFIDNEIAFGQTQLPTLLDFADGVNTLEFLNNL